MAYHLVTWGSAEGISCRTKRISFLCADARRPALIRRFLETVFGATFTALQPLATHPASLRAPFHFLTPDRTPKHWVQVISAIGRLKSSREISINCLPQVLHQEFQGFLSQTFWAKTISELISLSRLLTPSGNLSSSVQSFSHFTPDSCWQISPHA